MCSTQFNFESNVTPMTFLDIETSMRDPPMKILTKKGIFFFENTTALDFTAENDCFFNFALRSI